MRRLVLFLVLVLTPVSLPAQDAAPVPAVPASASAAVRAAIDALGGAERLASVRGIRLETMGHEFALEQSERPEGPWMAHYIQRQEWRDAAGQRLRRQTQTRNWGQATWSPDPAAATIAAGGVVAHTNGQRWRAGNGMELVDASDAFALAPERMLLTARDARDLAVGPSRTLQGVAHHSVTFTWQARPVTIFLNSWTHRPTMLQVVKPDRFGIWGEVTERRWYGWWDLQKGLWYPRQVTVEWNGFPFSDTSTMAFEVDAPLDDAAFSIPPDVVAAFAAGKDRPVGLASLELDETKAIDVSPGVVLLAGAWNVLLVRQADGIVIVEAPISSAYSEQVIAAAQKRFPGAPIKALVTTSDAWPHIGGVREYVARRIPVYALDLNVPILDRLVQSKRTTMPDRLSAEPARPLWNTVSALTTIGRGDLRIELMPVRGEAGERMMVASLPGIGLAYSSDLIQPGGEQAFFMPAMLAEVVTAFERQQIAAPQTVVGMHLSPTAWTEVLKAVRAAQRSER